MEPQVRFKHFCKPWKKLYLSDVFVERHQISTITEDLPQLSFTIAEGVISPEDRKSNKRDFLIKDISTKKYLVTYKEDIIYNPANVVHGAIHRNALRNGVVSPIYKIFQTDENAAFLEQIVRNPAFIHSMTKYMEGTVIKLRTLKPESFLKMTATITSSKEEQQLIANYFHSLSNEIQAAIKKVDILRRLKTASLTTMFPSKDENIPKVRFGNFKRKWHNEKAGSLFVSYDERNRPELPVLSACQDIRGMIPRESIGYSIFHDTSNEVTYKRVKPGQFVIHLRSFQGGFAHSSYDGIISPAYTVFDFKDKEQHDDYYWKIVFMSRPFINRLRLITYGIRDGRSISFNEFKELSFQFPSKEEQQAIAAYFRSLDRKIALETARLEKLKQIKLACLDKMFV